MNFKEYQEAARSTAIYDTDHKYPFVYSVLGLVDEVAELMEKLMVITHQHHDKVEEISKEIGDIMWYISDVAYWVSLADGFDVHLANIWESPEYGGRLQEFSPQTLKFHLVVAAGQIAGKVKKVIRDQKDYDKARYIPSKTADKINYLLGDMIKILYRICYDFELDFMQIAKQNIAKLKSRQERGKLQGSGDNR